MKNLINIAICDDEKNYRESVESLILKRNDAELFSIKQFFGGKELLSSKEKFHFVFIDIELQDSLGVDIALEIRKNNKDAFIIFITSYTQYISEAFKSMPFQYILKPIDDVLFNNEFNRALRLFTVANKTIEISWNNKKENILIREIVYIEHYLRKITFNMRDGSTYYGNGKLDEIMNILTPFYFVRIHNSFLLNLRYLKKIQDYKAIISKTKELPISKKYIKEVRKKYSEKITGVYI